MRRGELLLQHAAELLSSALDADCPNVDAAECRELAYRLCAAQSPEQADDAIALANSAYQALLRCGRGVRLGGMRIPGNRLRATLDRILCDWSTAMVRPGAELLRPTATASA